MTTEASTLVDVGAIVVPEMPSHAWAKANGTRARPKLDTIHRDGTSFANGSATREGFGELELTPALRKRCRDGERLVPDRVQEGQTPGVERNDGIARRRCRRAESGPRAVEEVSTH